MAGQRLRCGNRENFEFSYREEQPATASNNPNAVTRGVVSPYRKRTPRPPLGPHVIVSLNHAFPEGTRVFFFEIRVCIFLPLHARGGGDVSVVSVGVSSTQLQRLET